MIFTFIKAMLEYWTRKKQQRRLAVALESTFLIYISVRKIALHIVSYMTVLHLLNTDPALR